MNIEFKAWESPFYKTHHKALTVTITDTFTVTDGTVSKTIKLVEKGNRYGYVYKFLKTQVNCCYKDDIIKHLTKATDVDSVWHSSTYALLKKLLNK